MLPTPRGRSGQEKGQTNYMPSHFSSIGFPVSDPDEFRSLAVKALAGGQSIQTEGGSYVCWREANGAEVWVQMDEHRSNIGMTPHFSGRASMRVGLVRSISRPNDTSLDGAYYGWADPTDEDPESGTYPFVFDSPDFFSNRVSLPALTNAQLAAFGHELQIYPDEKTFHDSQPKPGFAAESFIPSGLFTPKGGKTDPPNAHAIFTGRVVKCASMVNSFTGATFEWALVSTLGGEIDVVADPAVSRHSISAGNILSGSFWLSGRLSAA